MTHILIGLKNETARGTFHGAEGFEGISMEGTKITIIKEGTLDELQDYVITQRKKGQDAANKLKHLEDLFYNETLSEKEYVSEYVKLRDNYIKERSIIKFDKLIIVQGMII